MEKIYIVLCFLHLTFDLGQEDHLEKGMVTHSSIYIYIFLVFKKITYF